MGGGANEAADLFSITVSDTPRINVAKNIRDRGLTCLLCQSVTHETTKIPLQFSEELETCENGRPGRVKLLRNRGR